MNVCLCVCVRARVCVVCQCAYACVRVEKYVHGYFWAWLDAHAPTRAHKQIKERPERHHKRKENDMWFEHVKVGTIQAMSG